MATKIRGITIELGADTTGLDKALKDTNKEIKTTQNELKDVEKLLKLDPKNTELLRQKQELLGKQIGQTKDKLETLRKAEKEAEDQFKQGKISEDQYRAIKREVAETETNLRNLGKQADAANKKLSNVPETMNKIADKAKTAAQKTRGISLAAAGALTALGASVLNTVRNADDISTTSKKSGISTDRIQEYRYAADLIDVSADAIISANSKLKKNMASGGAAFDKLGVKVTDANGNLRDSSEVFDEVVLALSKIQNETERDTVAMEIFGKGADELAGLIDDGGASFRELAKEAHEAGAVLSQDSLNALNKTNDALDKLKAKGTAALGQVAEKLINNPKFDEFLDKTTEFLDKFVGAIAEMPLEKIETLVGILAGTAAISPLATLIGNVAGAIGKVSSALGGVSGASGLASAIGGAGGLTSVLGTVASALGPLALIAASVVTIAGLTAIIAGEEAKRKVLQATHDEGLAKEIYGEDMANRIGKEMGGWTNTIELIRDAEKRGILTRAEAAKAYAMYDAGDIAGAQTIVNTAGQNDAAKSGAQTFEEYVAQKNAEAYFAGRSQPQINLDIQFTGPAEGLGQVLTPTVRAEIERTGGDLIGPTLPNGAFFSK